MTPTLRIREDEIGPYIRHGDNKVRPDPDAQHDYLRGDGLRELYKQKYAMTVAVDNVTRFKVGDHVKKYHQPRSTRFTITELHGVYRELWFIHYD